MSESFPEPSQDIATLLAPLRGEIDALDQRLMTLLIERFAVVHRVAAVKGRHGIAPVLPDRIDEVLSKVAAAAASAGLNPDLARALWRLIIGEACAVEERMIATGRDGDRT